MGKAFSVTVEWARVYQEMDMQGKHFTFLAGSLSPSSSGLIWTRRQCLSTMHVNIHLNQFDIMLRYRCVYLPRPFVAMVNNNSSLSFILLFLFFCLVPFCWAVGSDAFRPYRHWVSLSHLKSLNQKYCICKSNGICFRTLSPRQWICSVRLTITEMEGSGRPVLLPTTITQIEECQ